MAEAVDLTLQYRGAVKRQRRSQGVAGTPAHELMQDATPTPSEWAREALSVLSSIAEVRNFILEHLSAYVQYSGSSGGAGLSEEDRDHIDSEALACVQTCKSRIVALQAAITNADPPVSGHARQHCSGVIDCLFAHLSSVASTVTTLRKERLRRAASSRNRLASGMAKRKVTKQPSSALPQKTGEDGASDSKAGDGLPVELDWFAGDVLGGGAGEVDEEEEAAMMAENMALAHQLETDVEAATKIEQQMEEIAEMVSFFATKVVDQDKQVDAVHDEAHQAHDNVTRGNEQLSEASQESFFARFFVLIFLIVASALLLFMDWYR